jgi:hypothetical protein
MAVTSTPAPSRAAVLDPARQQAEEARQQAQARAAALEEELRRLRGERGDS